MTLRAHHLSRWRGDRSLFSDLSFQVNPGESLHIVGNNGSGKTTLLEMLARGISQDQGTLSLKGASLQTEDSIFLGVCPGFKAALSVQENLFFWSQVYGSSEDTLHKALAYFDLEKLEDTLYTDLSTGQRQRLSLARLLLVERPLWLLDEPFSGLDPLNCWKLTHLLKDYLQEGGILCLASHLSCALPGQQLDLQKAFKDLPPSYQEDLTDV